MSWRASLTSRYAVIFHSSSAANRSVRRITVHMARTLIAEVPTFSEAQYDHHSSGNELNVFHAMDRSVIDLGLLPQDSRV